jgi:glycosyltransferase involved in cell wall biosynthesis
MTKRLTVAIPRDRYPAKFNSPRLSRHVIRPCTFVPTHKISHHIEGITAFWPGGHDLIHAVNRIPIGTKKPFVISFESHLPRYFGGEGTRLFQFMRQQLAAPSCWRIIGFSECAKNIFLGTHNGCDEYDALFKKVEVIYPNIILPEYRAEVNLSRLPLKLVFVGSHFGRKGGAASVRAAQIARERRLPIEFHIISSLSGRAAWCDPKNKEFFDPYFRLLDADNVTFQSSLPNYLIIEALRKADFSILTTLSDTFGYSAIESLSVGTPVVATPVGALPEFINDGSNGLIIPLEVDSTGQWIHTGRSDKGSRQYESIYRDEIERMAHAIIDRMAKYLEAPERLLTMRKNARATAEVFFDSRKTSPILDDIYDQAVGS